MAADMGSSVQTRALYELFLALWLKILGKAVLSGRRRSRKRRAKHFRPQNGRGTTWVFKATGSAADTSQAYADGHCRSSMEKEGV